MRGPGKTLLIGIAAWVIATGSSLRAGDPSAVAPVSAEDAAQAATGSLFYPASPQVAKRTVQLGILGEVARPGVYEARADLSLAALIQRAGGVTRNAKADVRVVRNGRVTQQVFLHGGAGTPLMGGDLVLVERSRPAFPTSGPSGPATAVGEEPAEVQLAFLNLIERPVVVKMSRDVATVAKIVEFLGQADELSSKVRIIGPAGSRNAGSPVGWRRPLESGTVLVFPSQLIRAEFLPVLPEAIAAMLPVEWPPRESVAPSLPTSDVPEDSVPGKVASRIKDFIPTFAGQPRIPRLAPRPAEPGTNEADFIAPQLAGPSAIEDKAKQLFGQSMPPDAMIAGPLSGLSSTRPLNEGAEALTPFLKDAEDRPPAGQSDAGPTMLVGVIGTIAVVSMVMTIVPMGRRWFGGAANRSSEPVPAPFGSPPLVVPPAPLPTSVPTNRRLRVDARQPMSRLSIDLAVLEKAAPKTARADRTTSVS